MPADSAADDETFEEWLARLEIPPLEPPSKSDPDRISADEFIRLMHEDKAGRRAFEDEVRRSEGIARAHRRRMANIQRAAPRHQPAGPASRPRRQRGGLYAHGMIPLDTSSQIFDDTRWLPFGNGPASYYFLRRFERSKGDLRKALQMGVAWQVTTKHRLDVTSYQDIPWAYNHIFEHLSKDEEAARWYLASSIAKTVGFDPPQSWADERERFDEAMDKVWGYNRVQLRQRPDDCHMIDVKALCQLFDEDM